MAFLTAEMGDSGKSRWTINADAGRRQPMPPLDAGQYLADAFGEIGRITSTGFGPVPLTWAEIDAYARQTGTLSEPWEARCLRAMSHAYLEGLEIGKNALGREPWSDDA
jgi:hypothetical protein